MFFSGRARITLSLGLASAVLLALCLAPAACSENTTPAAPEQQRQPVSAASGEPRVYMCGRSVMENWFAHWGGTEQATLGGCRLIHVSVGGPPDIVQDVKDVADSIPAGSKAAVFYKLCFVDFSGGDRDSAADNLAANEAYADAVLDCVVNAKHLPLIIGNALPRVRGDTDSELVWNHRQYNAYLQELAASHPGQVYVFDFYGPLAVSGGWLNPAYESSSDDSHPSDMGYGQLDGPLVELLGQVFP